MAPINGGPILTTYDTCDDPPSKGSRRNTAGARLHHRRCGVREAAVCALGHVGGGQDVLPRLGWKDGKRGREKGHLI